MRDAAGFYFTLRWAIKGHSGVYACLQFSLSLLFRVGTAATVSDPNFFIACLVALPYPAQATGMHDVEFEYLSLFSGYILKASLYRDKRDTMKMRGKRRRKD